MLKPLQCGCALLLSVGVTDCLLAKTTGIVHDAEYYILEAQNRQVWEVEDGDLDIRLADRRARHGGPPNITHIMWDDTSFGDVGIPTISSVESLEEERNDDVANSDQATEDTATVQLDISTRTGSVTKYAMTTNSI